ncbi:histone-fold-containing protein [Sphaerosporella brunnea]|uniref:Histone-fold-containing protein n=1 Tax=Sphaerosporella brunnea TaxID=1250544 RepID=A0A5J5ERX5_9PEZI|nr:histone-fold-containing protein [Sphaerosporella brunnea]
MPNKPEISAQYTDPNASAGHSALPRARIMKIIKTDDDIYQCNKQAAHLVSIATEMFIQYLAEQGVKSLAAERKQRKTIQYKDLANAVARIDKLEFLTDVIPQVHAVKPIRETKPAKSKKKQQGTVAITEAGQTTLSAMLKTKEPDRVSATPEVESDGEPEHRDQQKDKGKGKEVERPESPRTASEDEDVIME